MDAAVFLAAVAGHPFFFLVAYFVSAAVPGVYIETATNEGHPNLLFFLPLLALLYFLRYGAWLLKRRLAHRPTPEEALARFARAHKPALFSLPVTAFLSVAPVEGNAFGFVVLPLLLLLSLVIGVMIWRRIRAIA